MGRLHFEFPPSLDEWDQSETYRGTHIALDGNNVLNMISIIEDNNLKTALPSVYYKICSKYSTVSPAI